MTTRMNPELRERWAAALESGDYRQGSGTLRDTNARGDRWYCCLGVLCQLAVDDGVLGESREEEGNAYFGAARDAAYLPSEVIAWAGLEGRNPYVRVGDWTPDRSLVSLNDSGVPFAEVARLIREQL